MNRDGFPCRRTAAEYLKTVFPAGYNVNNNRQNSTSDIFIGKDHSPGRGGNDLHSHFQASKSCPTLMNHSSTISIDTDSVSSSTSQQSPLTIGSYHAWTKGNVSGLSLCAIDDNEDPYADVSGPYFNKSFFNREKRKLKQSPGHMRVIQLDSLSNDLVQYSPMPLSKKQKKAKPFNSKMPSPSPSRVFQPPRTLAPLKLHSKSISDEEITDETEQKSHRSQHVSIASSPSRISVDTSSLLSNALLSCNNSSESLTIILQSFKDLVGSNTLRAIPEYRVNNVNPNSSFEELKQLICKNLFPFEDIKIGSMEIFQFVDVQKSWKVIASDTDWAHIKLSYMETHSPIRIMFAVDRESDFESAVQMSGREPMIIENTHHRVNHKHSHSNSHTHTNHHQSHTSDDQHSIHSNSSKAHSIDSRNHSNLSKKHHSKDQFIGEETMLDIRPLQSRQQCKSSQNTSAINMTELPEETTSSSNRTITQNGTLPTLSNYPATNTNNTNTNTDMNIPVPQLTYPMPQTTFRSVVEGSGGVKQEALEEWALVLESRLMKTRW